MNRRWLNGLAALVAVGALAGPSSAVQFTERRGDFYYDANGQLVGMRHVDPPADFVRRPMSAREQFDMLGIQLPPTGRALEPRWIPQKRSQVVDGPKVSRDKIIVQFAKDTKVRLRSGQLLANGSRMSAVDAILAKYPEARVQRAFDTEERILDENKVTGELIGGKELADLNNFYMITTPTPSERGVALANELLALDNVETAYLQAHGEAPACADIAPPTGYWRANQFYLDAAPAGVDAVYAWAYHPGGNGAGVGFWVMDLEWAWCFNHEDINIVVGDVVNTSVNNTSPEHGTSVLGEIGSCDNAYGTTGITSDVQLKMCDFDNAASWGAAIGTADSWLLAGEVMLLEIHIWGGPSGLACTCNCGQFEYVPVEWDVASYNAIVTAVANGKVVVEAGGNGSMNLDSAIYGGWFNPVTHNSGAIVVGAGMPVSHSPECWTDYGSRVDVHAYGDGIYSTGYGDLFNQASCEQDYTATFGGTSGASPIIVGCCASLQGIANQKYGYDISPGLMRSALKVGGTPQGAPLARNIGPMPNLVNAINAIEPDLVAYTPAGWTYPAVPRTLLDSNSGFAPLPAAALPGNVAGTHWNWAERNQSAYSPTINTPAQLLAVDESWLWQAGGNLAAGAWAGAWNVGNDTIKGGRHTVWVRSDYTGVEDEANESNNDFARQFIWSPYVLSLNTPVTRTYDPPKTSTGWGPYFNAEGFQGTTGLQYWYAFAVMPVNSSDDFDVYLHNEAPANIPQQGFGAQLATSTLGANASDFVIVDLNTVAGGTYYASGIDYAGTGNKVMEFDDDNGVVANPGINGPYTLGAGNLIELHEIYLTGGTQTRVEIQWLSGNANYGLSVHRSPSGFSSKTSAISGGYADNVGSGQNEYVIVDPGTSNWHGIAVWKSQPADLNQNLTYNLVVSQSPNLIAATPSGWYGPVVPRNTTDATLISAPLPATLNGNQTTTSYNFSTYNQGPNTANAPWQTRLFVDDDFSYWWQGSAPNLGPSLFSQWINTAQGLNPHSLVRGGRHHIRIDADALGQVPEIWETDNTFVDWFVWTPYDLVNQTPVTRAAPPLKDPVAYSDYSVDGFRAAPLVGVYWTGVGVLPTNVTADYDVRIHAPSSGSKNGFDAALAWSGDAIDGNVDFAFVNYNVAVGNFDYGILNWNANAATCSVQRADSPYWGLITTGITKLGPFTLTANEVFDLHEVNLGNGTPMYISINNVSGNANLGVAVYDGNVAYHNKFSYTRFANANGDGGDEHLTAFTPTGQYWGIAVFKNATGDLPKNATYEIVISAGSSAVDVPVIEPAPTAFALSVPRPNPFRGATQLRFDVPANGGRSLVAVFDLQGRRVATLAEGEQAVGHHNLTWDGRDSAGRAVAAGVYFVRLETPKLTETRKLTLLR